MIIYFIIEDPLKHYLQKTQIRKVTGYFSINDQKLITYLPSYNI